MNKLDLGQDRSYWYRETKNTEDIGWQYTDRKETKALAAESLYFERK